MRATLTMTMFGLLLGCGGPAAKPPAPPPSTMPPGDGGNQPNPPPTDEGVAVDVSIGGYPGVPTISGRIKGDTFTITDAPTAFVDAATVSGVWRGSQSLVTSDQITQSCMKPLGTGETTGYEVPGLLVNPLAPDLILENVRALPEGKDVRKLANPLVLESATFTDASFSSAESVVLKAAGSTPPASLATLPSSQYSWKVLCQGLQGLVPLSLTIRGKLGDQPYQGRIDYTSFLVATN
jgi:hypothetical protein